MLDIINLSSIPTFLLVLVRVVSFFVTLPLFSYRTIPNQFKIGLAFFLSLIMFYNIDFSYINLDEIYVFLLLKEEMIGLLSGLFASIIIADIQIPGGFIDFQVGFAIAIVMDPQSG